MHDEHRVATSELQVAASCMLAVVLQELARDAGTASSEVQAAVRGACALALLAAAAQGPKAFMIQSPKTVVFTTEDMKKGSVWLPRAAHISVILNEARDYPACMFFELAASRKHVPFVIHGLRKALSNGCPFAMQVCFRDAAMWRP